jgi:flagellar basal-body rod modification protein FlgD
MNINQVTGAHNSSASVGAGGQKTDSNMFMTLLVAQLKNQDPLEPQDGTAFVAQLAQFNSLDQLIGIRQAMEALVSSVSTTSPQQTDSSY